MCIRDSLDQRVVGVGASSRRFRKVQQCLPVIRLFEQGLGIHMQQHAKLFRRAVAAARYMCRQVSFLVFHEACLRSILHQELRQAWRNIVSEDDMQRRTFSDTSSLDQRFLVGFNHLTNQSFLRLRVHFRVALRNHVERE